MIKYLTDRPCAVCEFHKENGCSKWSCVFEGEPTPKNDLGVDCIDRKMALDTIQMKWKKCSSGDDAMQESIDAIRVMPSVTLQEPKTDKYKKEIDHLHKYITKLETQIVEQEPKPMVEIDLYSVIKQKYIEREALDKIRADITKLADTIPFNIGEVKAKYRNYGQHDGLEQALEIIEGNIEGDFDIDKWMAESEGK